jgi:hypothetical protein
MDLMQPARGNATRDGEPVEAAPMEVGAVGDPVLGRDEHRDPRVRLRCVSTRAHTAL